MRRLATALAAATAALAATAPAAGAEVYPTVQARAGYATFLPYAGRPPAPGEVCQVDTGVDLNRDTSQFVTERGALDGGSGDDLFGPRHGTYMAQIIAAPVNGFGMVGVSPHVGVVSVRVLDPGQETFPFDYYRRGIDRCRQRKTAGRNITVILLAFGGEEAPTGADLGRLQDSVAEARRTGMNVVAGAGNRNGPVNFPAALGPVFAVGAADSGGAFCSFSARGAGLDILAPGCGVTMALTPGGEPAVGNGTSHASAFAAGALAALRSYRPDLTPDQAEGHILSTAGNGGNINVERAFEAAGLARVVAEGRANTPAPPEPSRRSGGSQSGSTGDSSTPAEGPALGELGPVPSPAPTTAPAGLPPPRFSARRRGRGVTVSVANRPSGARVVVTLYRAKRKVGTRSSASPTVRITRAPRYTRLSVRFSRAGVFSPTRTTRRPRG